jgi:flagellar biosynthetic protein FliR
MPVSTNGISVSSFRDIVGIASWMYAAGVIIALPAIGSLMLVNLSFGILSRAAPQISPFSIGFPMTIILGFVIMIITLPNAAHHLVEMSDHILSLVQQLVNPNG